jgi:hypothetical protein
MTFTRGHERRSYWRGEPLGRNRSAGPAAPVASALVSLAPWGCNFAPATALARPRELRDARPVARVDSPSRVSRGSRSEHPMAGNQPAGIPRDLKALVVFAICMAIVCIGGAVYLQTKFGAM